MIMKNRLPYLYIVPVIAALMWAPPMSAQTTVLLRDGEYQYPDITDDALDLLALEGMANWRAALGLQIGTDVQEELGFERVDIDTVRFSDTIITNTGYFSFGVPSNIRISLEETMLLDNAGVETLTWADRLLVGQWSGVSLTDTSNAANVLNRGAMDSRYVQRTEARYPMFVFTVPYGAPWTDIELKASTDNFDTLVYYYHGPGPTGSEIGDTPSVWYTDSGNSDRRQWLAQPTDPRASIAASLSDVNSEVGGIVVVITDESIEYQSDNTSLIFSYSWLDGTTTDDDPANRSIWRPAVPVRWVPADWTP